MQIAVVANSLFREELVEGLTEVPKDIVWVERPEELARHPSAAVVIDLLFDAGTERIRLLESLLPRLVMINCVECTLAETNPSFVRFNGWPTFLRTQLLEASCGDDPGAKPMAEEALKRFGKKTEWMPDQPGFITPRVVGMIINEAFLALDEGVSTRADIDTAMKLGTNYPYGPFEWAEKIGVDRVRRLLHQMALTNPRYAPAQSMAGSALS